MKGILDVGGGIGRIKDSFEVGFVIGKQQSWSLPLEGITVQPASAKSRMLELNYPSICLKKMSGGLLAFPTPVLRNQRVGSTSSGAG